MLAHDHQNNISERCSWICPANNIYKSSKQDAAQERLHRGTKQDNVTRSWNPGACFKIQGINFHENDWPKFSYTPDSSYHRGSKSKANKRTESTLCITVDGLNSFRAGKIQLAKAKYEAASAQGDIIALHNLGTMYLHGQGIQQDYARSLKCFKQCSTFELKESMSQLGYMYLHGRGVRKDLKEAIAWFKKAGEGEGSQAYAQFHLGMMYFLGIGVEKDVLQGCKWLERSARFDFPPALYNLAVILIEGLEGIQQNVGLAAFFLKRAAVLGDPLSQNNLGTLYANGIAVKKDFNKARHLFRIASRKGISAASFNLGELYNHGIGVTKDAKIAAKYYLRAATGATNPEAEFNLASLFLTGKGSVHQDLNISLYWFERAAMHGHQGARNNVRVLRSAKLSSTPTSPAMIPPVLPTTLPNGSSTTSLHSKTIRGHSSLSKFGAQVKKLRLLVKMF